MNQLFEVQQLPEYVGENGLTGLWGWMECSPVIDPYDSLATYDESVAIRQTWMAIAREEIYTSVLTYPGGFPAMLMNGFNTLYDEIRTQLGWFENLNQCWDYESFVQELTTVCIQAFQSAAKAYEEILEHAENLRLLSSMGMPLADSEKRLIRAVATRGK